MATTELYIFHTWIGTGSGTQLSLFGQWWDGDSAPEFTGSATLSFGGLETSGAATSTAPVFTASVSATATVHSATSDGYVRSTDADYADARSGTGTLDAFAADADLYAGQRFTGAVYLVTESFLNFDVSSLAGYSINSAVLSLFLLFDVSDTDFTLQVRARNWGDTLTTGDFVAGADLSALTLLASISTSGIGAENAYKSLTSEAALVTAIESAIAGDGILRVVLCSSRTVDNSTPTGNEYLAFSSADEASTTQDPKLEIVHSTPLPFGGLETSGTATFQAFQHESTAAITFAGLETSGTATFTAPAFSGASALVAAGLEISGTATYTPPGFNATAAVIFGGLETSGTATFTAPAFSAAATIAFAGLDIVGTATHDPPVFSSTASIVFAGLETSGSTTYTPPGFNATATLVFGGLDTSGSATFTTPVFSATAAPVFGGLETSGTVTFTVPTFSAVSTVVFGGLDISGTATAAFVFSAAAPLTFAGLEASATASVDHVATATLTLPGLQATSAATSVAPDFFGECAAVFPGLQTSCDATFIYVMATTVGLEYDVGNVMSRLVYDASRSLPQLQYEILEN